MIRLPHPANSLLPSPHRLVSASSLFSENAPAKGGAAPISAQCQQHDTSACLNWKLESAVLFVLTPKRVILLLQ